jgi:serine/threonine protein kinase/tetratricopeptide (TPR) repeat protein
MHTDANSARTIFLDALDRSASDERERFIESACAGNDSLRREVDRLLAAHGELNDFMHRPAGLSATASHRDTVQVGDCIGRYKLLEQIGEGGMGVVYVAEQTEPVRRRVALKIIKPGMDTRQVIARFEAERQALAMMDHPNIAKVFDGGTTSTESQALLHAPPSSLTSDPRPLPPALGRPYFVMELVRGMPITDYCDQAKLDVRGRLDLFTTVCHAVQHAHQKGVIHRDLKPNNVLVTLHDGQPVVKVIDFGIAKAINQQLTERTIYTAFTEIIGTPLYMSPEQAELSGLDVDTRSDVYSLGVLLYELLTGQTPFDRDTLIKAGLDEVRRMIREDEPPRPSHRISTLAADAGSTVSHKRGIDQRQLTRALKGELDWIVMKALEKDRNRRYESATALAGDIERYQNHEPVDAGPPSALYRFRKFARRRRGVMVAVSLIVLSLFTGAAIAIWQAAAANDARELADERASKELAARRRAEANLRRGNEAVDRLLSRVAEERLLNEPHLEDLRRNLLTDALDVNSSFLEENPEVPEAQFEAGKAYGRMASIHEHLGDFVAASKASLEAIRILEGLGESLPSDRRVRRELARCYQVLSLSRFNGAPGQGAENLSIHQKHLQLYDELVELTPDEPELLAAQSEAAVVLGFFIRRGNQSESQKLLRRGLEIREKLVNQHPARVDFTVSLARAHWFLGRVSTGEVAKRQFLLALSHATAALDKSPRMPEARKTKAEILTSIADVCADKDDLDSGLDYAQQAEILAESLLKDYPSNEKYYRMLVKSKSQGVLFLQAKGLHDEALQKLQSFHKAAAAVPGGSTLARRALELSVDNASFLITLGVSHYREGQWKSAIVALEESIALDKEENALNASFLAMANWQLGNHDDAHMWYERAVAWMAQHDRASKRLLACRKEAEELLGLTLDDTAHWEQVLADRRSRLGREHADTLRASLVLAHAYLSAGRAIDAVPLFDEVHSAKPSSTPLLVQLGALQAWFGMKQELDATCRRALAHAQGTDDPSTADRTAKVCSLRPSADPGELEAALELGRNAGELGAPWGWFRLAHGMAAFRSGRLTEADQALKAAADQFGDHYGVDIAKYYLAMSLFKQGKLDEARQVFTEAAANMAPLPADEKNPTADSCEYDYPILWLAYKEARDLIGPEEKPADQAQQRLHATSGSSKAQ